jgi:YesN/AraC family two-component response regulator
MSTFPVLDDLKYICKLMFDTFEIPVFFLNEKGDLVFEFSSSYVHNPLYLSKKDLLNQLYHPEDPSQFPVLRTTNYFENFFSICLKIDDIFKGTIIVGPSVQSELSEEMIKGIINDFGISKKKNDVIHYFKSLPVLSNLKLINASMLLYYMIYNVKLDIATIVQQNKLLEKKTIEIENVDLTISKRRQALSFHHDPLLEKKIFQCIKEGRKEALLQNLRLLLKKEELGVLSKTSHLRSQKNLAIAGITLATRYAIEGGLHPEIAYTLSDLYIQNLEELKDSKAVDSFLEDALCEFAERVQNSQKQKYTKPIRICLNYIFTHLYEKITLSKLAEIVAMNPNYLSVLFKKEVGISLSEYIQRAKVEEAKKLITFTNYSLSEIYTLLNFYDQSYFTKVFKKFTGVTPKQFKSKHVTL